jgi:hypothetical protein
MSEIFISKDDSVSEIYIAANITPGNIRQIAYDNVDFAVSGVSPIFTKYPIAGNLLIIIMAVDKDSGLFEVPDGFTEIYQNSGVDISLAVFYKIAEGLERGLFTSWENDDQCSVISMEIEGSYELDSSNVEPLSSASVTSVTTGTATPTTTKSLGLCFSINDYIDNCVSPLSWTNGYANKAEISADTMLSEGWAAPAVVVATKVFSEISAQESTFSHSGGADQMQAGIAIFKEV